MNSSPIASVIIPYYNHGLYINEACESIVNQSFQNIEIIIVNDGTDDPYSLEIIQSLKFPKTRIIHQENKGVASARNFGISKAKGKYIVNLDADDYFESTFIEKGVQVLNENKEVGVVTCYIQHFGRHFEKGFPLGGRIENFLYKNNACGDAMFRKECWEQVNGFSENLTGYEDWEFWIKITKLGWSVHVIPEFLVNYRLVGEKTRSLIDFKNRRKIFMEFLELHKSEYNKHFEIILKGFLNEVEKQNERIEDYEEKIKAIYSSKSYRLGNSIINFLNVFRKRKN